MCIYIYLIVRGNMSNLSLLDSRTGARLGGFLNPWSQKEMQMGNSGRVNIYI